jgi:glyoxylase-like metal-dependent hydrolase (beta-lactamase superfamily II)
MSPTNQPSQIKLPRVVLNNIFAFPPNRETLGGTSYFIVGNEGNILIDSPAWDTTNQDFISAHGGVSWLFITHRDALAKIPEIQQAYNCEVLIQEQEAYLLPGLQVTTFAAGLTLNSLTELIWTPGHSPGSACLYYADIGGILFTGRHLLPNLQAEAVPIRTAKTFHWLRQIRSLHLLCDRFSPETLQYICPGANTGYLRGQRYIDNAYYHLKNIDLEKLAISS